MSERRTFGLTGFPLPKNAEGKTYFSQSLGHQRFSRAFRQLIDDPGLGVLTGDAGVGKTVAIRNECKALKRPDHMVIYLCHTNISSLDLYRAIANELGVPIAHRRGQLWTNIKKGLSELVDDKNISPVVVIDEAQNLSDDFLVDLAAFLNFAFDSRDLLTLWLVGLPALARKLHMHQHAALATRIASEIRLDPLEREAFLVAIEHGLKAVGATQKLLGDQAIEILYRSSRGVLRIASKLLRTALRVAHARNQSFIDEQVMQAALDEMGTA